MSEASLRTPAAPLAQRKQLAKFIVVGLSNTALSFALFMAATAWLPAFTGRAAAAQAISYAAGILWSFMLNGAWVFNDHGGQRTFLRFLALQLLLLGATSLAIQLADNQLPGWHAVCWLAIMAVSTVANFLLMRKWVFPTVPRNA